LAQKRAFALREVILCLVGFAFVFQFLIAAEFASFDWIPSWILGATP
jgi:hypothetical protein